MVMGRRFSDALRGGPDWLELSGGGREGIEAAVDFWQGIPGMRYRRYLLRAGKRTRERRMRESYEYQANIIWQKEFYYSGLSESEIVTFVSDMEEIVELSDRAVVMFQGHIKGELAKEEISQASLMNASFNVVNTKSKGV